MKSWTIIATFALPVSGSAGRDPAEILEDVLAEGQRVFVSCVAMANSTVDDLTRILKKNGPATAPLLAKHVFGTRSKAEAVLTILAQAVQTRNPLKIKMQAYNTNRYIRALVDSDCDQYFDIAFNQAVGSDEDTQVYSVVKKMNQKLHKELEKIYNFIDELAG